MKKRLAASLFAILCPLVLFGGCALNGNNRARTEYVHTYEADGKIFFCDVKSVFGGDADRLSYDPQSGALVLETGTAVDYADPAVLNGNTFPLYTFEASEGYEGLTEKLTALDGREDPLVQAYALKADDGSAYGFCNLYSSTTGFFAGGGQCDVKKIVKSVLFAYSPETDELKILDEMDKCCVVAFNGTHYVYFYERDYYLQEIEKSTAIKLCADGAYDTGLTNYSYAEFYFNKEYCIFKFHRGYSNYKREYDDFLLYRMNGEKLAELRIPSNFD